MKKILILLITISFFSCDRTKENSSKDDVDLEINMSIGHNDIEFCELVEELKVVKLETTENSLIGAINQVKVFDDKIFVHDLQTQSILIFEYPNGNYINKIESVGKGPGEYFNVSSFSINKNKKLIALLDINLSKIFKFKFNGEFIESKSIPFYAHSFSYMNEDENVIFSNFSLSDNPENDYQAIITDENFNIVNKFLKIDKFSSMQIQQGNQISIVNNRATFLPKNSVDYYTVNNNEIEKKYFLNFKENWNEELFYKEVNSPRELVQILNKNEIIRALGVSENKNFLFIDFWFLNNHHLALYNKEKNSVNYIKKNKNGFENRLFIYGINNDYFISAKYHDELKIAIENDTICNINEDDQKMILNLDNIDNPILIFTKFSK